MSTRSNLHGHGSGPATLKARFCITCDLVKVTLSRFWSLKWTLLGDTCRWSNSCIGRSGPGCSKASYTRIRVVYLTRCSRVEDWCGVFVWSRPAVTVRILAVMFWMRWGRLMMWWRKTELICNQDYGRGRNQDYGRGRRPSPLFLRFTCS